MITHPRAGMLVLANERIKVTLENREGYYQEFYFAKNSDWHLLLESGNRLRLEPALKCDGHLLPFAFTEAKVITNNDQRAIVFLIGRYKNHLIVKIITLGADDPFVQIFVAYRALGTIKLDYLLSTYSFVPDGRKYAEYKPLDFIFTPQLRPESNDIIADHTFRSPALMLQHGPLFAALIPDVEMLTTERTIKTGADVQIETSEAPLLSYGFMNWQRRDHVYYTMADPEPIALEDQALLCCHYLFLNARAEPRRGFQDVVRFHWATHGRNNLAQPQGPQAEPFANYIRKAWDEYLPHIALDGEYNGKSITLLRQGRLAWSNNLPPEADNDNWFNVWFQSLRTAYGMYLHGKNADDATLRQRATNVLNLALSAPQHHGIAPSIFYLDSRGGHWVADHAWGGIANGEYYAMFHNAWTGYWLLQWLELVPERSDEILNYTQAFADFLLAQQRPSGVIPSWYHPETLEPAEALRDENAETAGAALFLAEFYARTQKEKYLVASEKAMRYIFTQVLLERKWFDYETFFSCSRKPLGFSDAYTQQPPQNTLSMQQAAEACCTLYKLTGNEKYKEHGIAIIDYLCLYQQVWSPTWMSRQLFGGFGVQNTDAEWSDSRQGYFAVTLMNYHDLTGEREYFERGVAALRAMFALFESPDSPRTFENYGHDEDDRPGGVTGIHWGTGSSVVSIHMIQQRYGDAYVNVADKWGVGIDGCRITNLVIEKRAIRFELLDNVATPRRVKVKFARLIHSNYELTINEKLLGTFTADELQNGIDVAL
ncbi:MAG: hypothetical protein ONB45_17210 [candidate division KSB1 bacterium]|nr:hypothetical protein [candidate division KSB1 bacterium]